MAHMERVLIVVCVALYILFACACASTVFVTVPTPPILATPTAEETPTLMDNYKSFLPYAANEDMATPTRIDLRTPTPRATATRFTGTRPPTVTPYP